MALPTKPTENENAEYWSDKADEANYLVKKYAISPDTAWIVSMLSTISADVIELSETLLNSVE